MNRDITQCSGLNNETNKETSNKRERIETTDSNKKPKTTCSFDVLPDEIFYEIFQFISNESTNSCLMLTCNYFKCQILKCSPYRNILSIASILNCKCSKQPTSDDLFAELNHLPPVIEGKFSPFTYSQISFILKLIQNNNALIKERSLPPTLYLPIYFLTHNKNLDSKLSNQIIKCAEWDLDTCKDFEPIAPIVKLSEKILNNYYKNKCNDSEKEEIFKNEWLSTALFNTFTGKEPIWKHLKDYQDITPASTDKIASMVYVTKDSWHRLKSLNESLKKDKDIVMVAVKIIGSALEFADESLKRDKDIIMAAITNLPWVLMYADKPLKSDKKFIMEAIKQNPLVLCSADKELQNDKEFIMAAVKKDGLMLNNLYSQWKQDSEIVLEAIKQNVKAVEFVHKNLKKDKEFIADAIKIHPQLAQHFIQEKEHLKKQHLVPLKPL